MGWLRHPDLPGGALAASTRALRHSQCETCRNVRCWRPSARGLLDQEDPIAVRVAEVRHRRHGTLAAPHFLELDAARAELGHRCLEVGRVEAKRGLATRLGVLLAHRRHEAITVYAPAGATSIQ